ncbi:MAG: flagellar hook-associated protein FlgL [Candidatus Loosdrechtia sp.]|uniref:flagellar hook-associated protein FlgL n=1 Tax=Candidatus Loosdrechtia sp. TaxID=3101272 RepID=UPI003A5ED5A6|nr:MAG: flagellar hook-associated protein FlgL [Candidatus Jettenia sp. AMX2]
MATRVNLEIFVNTTLANIQQNMSNMNKLQEQISTGKKINRPSDGPADTRNILRLQTEYLRLNQYSSNIQTAKQSLDFNASVLQNTSDILQRIRELTMQGVSSSVDQDGRNKIATEINQLLESVLQEANSSLVGRYIFAGTKTTTLPFEAMRNSNGQISEVNYNGNREKIALRIGPNTNVTVNQPGSEVFTDNELLSSIIQIRDALSGGTVSLAREQLNNLDNASKGILDAIAKAGSISNTLELVDNKVADTKLSLQNILSSTESADLAELVLRLREQENIFQASLAFSALIFKTSILDYL